MKKNIVVLGSGESGVGAAILAKQVGYTVFVSDKNALLPVFKSDLEKHGIEYEENGHSIERILGADQIIKSPGIPEKSPVMQAIREKNIPVIGEIELGAQFVGQSTILAITGSNGKTTTTYLLYHILKHAGLNVRMGGNVGKSFAEMVAEDLSQNHLEPERHFVLEVSSFQLDDIQAFKPNVSVLLNITPDHLDRYEYKLENYIKSKFRITMNQRGKDLFVTNANDVNIQKYLIENPGSVQCDKYEVSGGDLTDGYVRVADYSFDLGSSALKGPHNMFNAACAIRAALEVGVSAEVIEEAIYSFLPPPHRLERVAEIDGVLFINDSKATNVDSVFYALQAMDRPIVWIVGGTDKGNDYAPLFPFVDKNVKAIVCMGIDNVKLFKTFEPFGLPMVEAKSAEEAVRLANDFARAGDVVLLSPACASFDLFKNYEDRGDQFKKSVLALKSM